jgi:hypothetical protein
LNKITPYAPFFFNLADVSNDWEPSRYAEKSGRKQAILLKLSTLSKMKVPTHLSKPFEVGPANSPRLGIQPCFVQFLPIPQLRGIFDASRLTSNLYILKHLLAWQEVANQLLFQLCIESGIWFMYQARTLAKVHIGRRLVETGTGPAPQYTKRPSRRS